MRRTLFILDLALLALLLAAWIGSYYRQAVVIIDGYGGTMNRGRFYFAGPDLFMGTRVSLESPSGFDMELVMGDRVRWWIPFRQVPRLSLWIVEPWTVAIVLAVPLVLAWRRRRKRFVDQRGFEVEAVKS
jgi:hypothetical protein